MDMFGLNPPPLLIPPNNLDLDSDDPSIDPDLSSPRVTTPDPRSGSFAMSPLLSTEAETSESDEIIGYRFRRQIGRRDTEFENLSKLIATMRAISKLDEALLAGPSEGSKKEESDADRMMRLEKRMSRDSKILQRDLLAEFSGMSPGNRDDLWSKVTSPRGPAQPAHSSSALGLPRISTKGSHHLSAFSSGSATLSPVSSAAATSPTGTSTADTMIVKHPPLSSSSMSSSLKKSSSKKSLSKKPETSREMRRRIEAADPLEYDMIIHAPDEVKWALVQVEREMRLAEAAKYASKTSLSALARRYMYRSPYRQRDSSKISSSKRGSSTIDLSREDRERLPRESTKLPLASSADLYTTMSETTLTTTATVGGGGIMSATKSTGDVTMSPMDRRSGDDIGRAISDPVTAPPNATRMRSRSTGETFGMRDRPRMKDRRTGPVGSATVGVIEDDGLLLGSPSDDHERFVDQQQKPHTKVQTTVVMSVLSEDDELSDEDEELETDDDIGSADGGRHSVGRRPRFEEADSHNLLTPDKTEMLRGVSDELSSVSDEDLSRNETELTESKSQPEPISHGSQSKFQFTSFRSVTSAGGNGESQRLLVDHPSGMASGSESPMSPTSLQIRNKERRESGGSGGTRRRTLSKTPREKKTSFKEQPKVRRPHTPSAYEESLDSTDRYEYDVGPDGACRMISRSMISLRSLQNAPLANRSTAAGAMSTDTQTMDEELTVEPVGPLSEMHSPVQSLDAGRYSNTLDYSNVVTPPPGAAGAGGSSTGPGTEYEHSRNESENQPETDLFPIPKKSIGVGTRSTTVHYSTRKTTAGRMTQLASVDEHTALSSRHGESERELHALKHHLSHQQRTQDNEWLGSVQSESADFGGTDFRSLSPETGWVGKWHRIKPMINVTTICLAVLYALLCFGAGVFTGRFLL